MTRRLLKTVAPEADLSAALWLMVAYGVNELPVVQDGVLGIRRPCLDAPSSPDEIS
jgi:CBS domain-containing protein